MAANKCNIASYALRNLAGLIYGFNCDEMTCKIVENYVEYLNCPEVEFHPCDVAEECDTDPVVVSCTMTGVTLSISNITINSATATFVAPEHEYTLQLYRGATLVDTKESPASPVNYIGLIPNTAYTVILTQHCPFGDELSISQGFTTLIACAAITDVTGTTGEE